MNPEQAQAASKASKQQKENGNRSIPALTVCAEVRLLRLVRTRAHLIDGGTFRRLKRLTPAPLEQQSETFDALPPNHEAEENRKSLAEDAAESDSEEGLVSVHSIILDWTPVCFIDSVGVKAIKQVRQETRRSWDR